jgi:hypothetical protein
MSEPTSAIAVNVAGVDMPLQITVTLDEKSVGAEGGVFAAMDTVIPPVVTALHTPAPRSRTQQVMASLRLTEQVFPAVAVIRLSPTVLPVPHSYTAPEPMLPPLAVNVAEVDVPSHIAITFDIKLAGAEGGVFSAMTCVPVICAAQYIPLASTRAV